MSRKSGVRAISGTDKPKRDRSREDARKGRGRGRSSCSSRATRPSSRSSTSRDFPRGNASRGGYPRTAGTVIRTSKKVYPVDLKLDAARRVTSSEEPRPAADLGARSAGPVCNRLGIRIADGERGLMPKKRSARGPTRRPRRDIPDDPELLRRRRGELGPESAVVKEMLDVLKVDPRASAGDLATGERVRAADALRGAFGPGAVPEGAGLFRSACCHAGAGDAPSRQATPSRAATSHDASSAAAAGTGAAGSGWARGRPARSPRRRWATGSWPRRAWSRSASGRGCDAAPTAARQRRLCQTYSQGSSGRPLPTRGGSRTSPRWGRRTENVSIPFSFDFAVLRTSGFASGFYAGEIGREKVVFYESVTATWSSFSKVSYGLKAESTGARTFFMFHRRSDGQAIDAAEFAEFLISIFS